MANRDDINIRHFKSRSQQSRVLANPLISATDPGTINMYLIFDSKFGQDISQIDSTRFKYIGTSPQNEHYSTTCAQKRMARDSMTSCFNKSTI